MSFNPDDYNWRNAVVTDLFNLLQKDSKEARIDFSNSLIMYAEHLEELPGFVREAVEALYGKEELAQGKEPKASQMTLEEIKKIYEKLVEVKM